MKIKADDLDSRYTESYEAVPCPVCHAKPEFDMLDADSFLVLCSKNAMHNVDRFAGCKTPQEAVDVWNLAASAK
jgi:hypothetical protein